MQYRDALFFITDLWKIDLYEYINFSPYFNIHRRGAPICRSNNYFKAYFYQVISNPNNNEAFWHRLQAFRFLKLHKVASFNEKLLNYSDASKIVVVIQKLEFTNVEASGLGSHQKKKL